MTLCIDDLTPSDPTAQRLCEIFLKNHWDFISAQLGEDHQLKLAWGPDHIPKPKKPQWRTERRYPMKSRVFYRRWLNTAEVIGVRFTHTTRYAVVDIDIGSRYHPKQNPNGIAELRMALETIGLVRSVLICSSHSGGLHLYLPLDGEVKTFDLAVSLKFCLESCGFEVKDGQLEIFPNDKAYGVVTKILYKGHRLPLQPKTGSYLLNDDFEPIGDSLSAFFGQWDIAASGQDMSELTKAMSVARLNRLKKPRRRLNKVEEWRKDLEATLEEGWTGPSQTNQLLKEIGCYGVVFLSLSGGELAEHIVETARNMPGYRKWCQHQREIEKRSHYWAKSVENYYWPLGSRATKQLQRPKGASHNEKLAAKARESIAAAVSFLRKKNLLPEKTTARVKAIIEAIGGMSRDTLYRNKSLWHPEHCTEEKESVTPSTEGVEPVIPPSMPALTLERKPQKQKELRTKGESMKCRPTENEAPLKEKPKLLPLKGGSGGVKSFPQPQKTIKPRSFPSDDLLIPSPIVSRELIDTINSIRTQISRLKWDIQAVTTYIASRFSGKRRAELNDEQLLTLLYYLQNEST